MSAEPGGHTACCRRKAAYHAFSLYYIVITLDVRIIIFFRNKSCKPQPIQTTFGTHAQVKGRQRLGNFGRDRTNKGKIGCSDISGEASVFFCFVHEMTFRPLLNVRFSLHLEITRESSFSNIFTLGVFCAFLDASKAFDTVLHCGLLVKLQKKNISLSFVQILRNWYRKLNASVLWNGVYGRIFPILCGVRQGGVLSLMLFSIYNICARLAVVYM